MTDNPHFEPSSGIFLMVGGFHKTVIESQVLAHVRNMTEVAINMEVWSIAFTRGQYLEGLAALPALHKAFPAINIRLFRGIRPELPYSDWFNALVLLWWMRRLDAKPSFVHARTEHATMIAAIAKRLRNYCLIWDARGDTRSEFREYARRLRLRRRWLVPLEMKIISRRLNVASRQCDAAIFVSEELRTLDGKNLPIEKTIVVPCLADESLFYFDPHLRETFRAELGYGEKDIVIAYVGSTAIWQCVPETIMLMEQALRANASVKVLIVTPDRGVFEDAFSCDLRDRVRITSGSLHEMNRYLNAADFGVLLRKSNAINKVASPVKFAEYSLAGLTVVTTDAVAQVKEFGRGLANTVEASEFMKDYVQSNVKPTNRLDISVKARAVLGRKSHIDKLEEFYKLFALPCL
jgi:hypothetical protein